MGLFKKRNSKADVTASPGYGSPPMPDATPPTPDTRGLTSDPSALYSAAEAAAGTWFDPTGRTAYDRVLIRLQSVSKPNMRVAAQLVGGRCGNASVFLFSPPADGGSAFGMACMLACKRGAQTSLEITVGPECEIANGYEQSEKTVVPGKDACTLRCPVPQGRKDSKWIEHSLGADRPYGTAETVGLIVKLEVRFEAWESPVLARDSLAALQLQEIVFRDLPEAASPTEKAVLSYMTRPGNTKMIYWLPGRNDLFVHSHAAAAFLNAGFDVFVIEHRRMGRANRGCSSEDMALASHVGGDLRVVMHDFDLGLKQAQILKLKSRGSPSSYTQSVLYGHSTGGLEAAMWLRERGQKLPFSMVVLNSPFLDFGNSGMADGVLAPVDNGVYRVLTCLPGLDSCISDKFDMLGKKEPDSYGTRLWMQYPVIDPQLRNVVNIGGKVTLGWVKAVREQHELLTKTGPCTKLMTLVLATPGDSMLGEKDLEERAKFVSPNASVHMIPYCRHDMLLNYDKDQNSLVLGRILRFIE